ncbi:MAG: ribonucleoside-diphosphate reductase subunit alpha [Legionellales bacterium]|jgi:ribonucleoside-diphosphate reductase alpha chain|nr:ribonucleoside-diphosphate reductase subunit alpha [Legionellales bacterium]
MSNDTVLDRPADPDYIKSNRPFDSELNKVDIKVIKRDGILSEYDSSKIRVAISKAFIDVEGNDSSLSNRLNEIANELTNFITQDISKNWPSNTPISIESIQDKVELALIKHNFAQVHRSYIVYREKHAEERFASKEKMLKPAVFVTLEDGTEKTFSENQILTYVKKKTANLTEVDPAIIVKETIKSVFKGIKIADFRKAITITTKALVEKDPEYSYAAARFTAEQLLVEANSVISPNKKIEYLNSSNTIYYKEYFSAYIEKAVELELLHPDLLKFDLNKLSEAIDGEKDNLFNYLSIQTLYDRYFIHYKKKRFELPQIFWMRIAMGLSMNEENKEDKAIEFYNVLSSMLCMSSSPTLFNSGTNRPQLSSCFLTTIDDDIEKIFRSGIEFNAKLSKYSGGLGNDWTRVRANGAHIKGTNGTSSGVVPFMKVADTTAVAVNQGGKRKGAVCAYLETWHLDILEFLDLRKNTGDDRRRTHDMNTANWIPDLFMQRVMENGEWTLFSPDEVPDLHEIYGEEFKTAYEAYEKDAAEGKVRSKSMPAVKLWRKMLSMLFETGHPWLTFKDRCNMRSPQQHCGVIHSSNLCTEITLNTSNDEVAVCNLLSLNLSKFVGENGVDQKLLSKTTKTAIRMLDNVIDINFYTIDEARNSNMKHRPIGLGLMGFQDALIKQKICYSSDEAVDFADKIMENISYYAIDSSAELAIEKGSYQSFEGSSWSKGLVPIDTIAPVAELNKGLFDQDTSSSMDWDKIREKVKKGMRNSNVLAIAPTATISNICGVYQSIEPIYQNLFVKSNMSGDFTVINTYLVDELKKLDLWDDVMVTDLKYYDGSIAKIERIPAEIKELFATAFEVDPKWLIEAASRRQKWIDQAQSLNLYMAQPSGKKLDSLYKLAWKKGLKTTYYLRSLGATSAEKSTLSTGALNAVQPATCSLTPDEGCEACQ